MNKKNIFISLSEDIYDELLLLIPKLKVASVQKVIKLLLEESLKIHNDKNLTIK